MAVPEQTPYQEFIANGSTNRFDLSFQCEEKDHLIVKLDEQVASIGDWTFDNNGVVFTTPPKVGVKVSLQRDTPARRSGNFQSYNNSFRPQAVNAEFDRIWWRLQELGFVDWLLDNKINDLKDYVNDEDSKIKSSINDLKKYLDQKDSELSGNISNLKNYVDHQDENLLRRFNHIIQAQGTSLDQLEDFYNYLMGRIASIAQDKGWEASFVFDGDQTQKQVNDELKSNLSKIKNAYVNILDFCRCDGTDESNKAINAVNKANSQRIPLYIPENSELLISGSTTLEPIYGLFGGGRIRRLKTGWTDDNPFVLINHRNQYVDGVTFLKHDVAYDDINNVKLTEQTPKSGFIEVTKNARNYKITNNKFRGGRFCNWIYGGESGLIFGNDSDTTEEAFIYFGATTAYVRPENKKGLISAVVIANNRVRNVSNESLGGTTGDGVKTTLKCKNLVFIGNDIQFCRGDAIDLFASGESMIIQGNILANNGVKGVDIKAIYDDYPSETWGINQQIVVTGNHIFGNTQSGVAVSNTISDVYMINITNNNIYDNGYWGIRCDANSGIIANNIVYNNGKYVQSYSAGIRIEGSINRKSKDLSIIGNVCINNGCDNSEFTNSCGIALFGYVDDVLLLGNRCHNINTPQANNTDRQNYGIWIPATCNNIELKFNKCTGNTINGIGWGIGAGIIGETRIVNIQSIQGSENIIFGNFNDSFGVYEISFQPQKYISILDADNYYIAAARKVSKLGLTTSIANSSLILNTNLIALVSNKKAVPLNTINMGDSLYLQITKTGNPPILEGGVFQVRFVTW